ncbi:MAG: efflux RND transporter permease subunit [Candidatus Omnitrophota bacterium]
MNLPNLSVRRPTAISMLFTGVILIGVIAFRLLPVEMMPNTSFGDITINIDVRGGIPASEIEKRIARPVEEAVGTVTHLKNILSISKEGNAKIILEFEPGTNMDFAALEVREKFNRIRNDLPREIEKPVIAKYEYMDVPIMILAITSDIRTPEELRKIVDDKIKDRIQRIEGVARAEVSGGREGKILVEIDQTKLQAYSLPINRVVDIINLNNANLLAGEIKKVKDKFLVRTIGEFESLKEIENLAIATTKQGSVIRLKDVGEVKDSFLEPTAFARVNTQPVVSIYIQKESTANTIEISRLIDKEIKTLKTVLDRDIRILPTFNQAEYIQKAVNRVKLSLGYGAILATLVLFVFLRDFRSVGIIAATIPVSILSTFSLMFFGKITLNVMTLSGLALGIGMLLDNSIVVLENTFKKRGELMSSGQWQAIKTAGNHSRIRKNLAIDGASEMLLAIVASTITTLVVFLPLVFINPEIRMLYSGIALTITFSLLASLLASLALVPMLASRLKFKEPRPAEPKLSESGLSEAADSETPAEPRPTVLGKVLGYYQQFLARCLSFRYLILVLALVAFALIFQQGRKLEKEFIGVAEQNKFTVFIEMPTGTKLEISDKIVSRVESIAAQRPEIKTFTAKIEPWSSKIYVELWPINKRKLSAGEIIEELRPQTDKIEPAFIYYEEPEEVGTKEILIELYGYDYEVLKSLAIQSAQRMQPIPKFTDVKIRMREGRPEMRLNIDKRQAALFGLTVEDIALTLHTHMRGLVATRYRGTTEPLVRVKEASYYGRESYFSPEGQKMLERKSGEFRELLGPASAKTGEAKEIETIVRLEERFRRTFEDLRRVSLVTPDAEQIYLSQLADFKFDLGPSEIWRKNKSRMVQVSANTGGTALGTAALRVKKALADLKFPKDYFWQFGGNYDKMIQNQKELSFALILSLVLVYMILASLFESLKQPFIILFTVPLAAIGAIAALRITGKPVGTGVLIGAIMLGGIVVNNAIILIDRINFLRRKSSALYSGSGGMRDAIIAACCDRLRPILMTSLTTILGLLPMALDKSESSNLWAPLAITVIGGLSVSTALTLFVIPGVYLVFEDIRIRKK